MRAFTSWRVTRSRAAMRVEVDLVDDRLVGLDRRRRATSTPRSRWAVSTAIHSRRSSTTLCSGDHRCGHLGAGVAGGEDVGDHVVTSSRTQAGLLGIPRVAPLRSLRSAECRVRARSTASDRGPKPHIRGDGRRMTAGADSAARGEAEGTEPPVGPAAGTAATRTRGPRASVRPREAEGCLASARTATTPVAPTRFSGSRTGTPKTSTAAVVRAAATA